MTFDEMRAALDTLTGLKFRPADYKTHWAGLQDMPLEVLRAAVARAAKQCAEFPTPAELRGLADASPVPVQPFDQSVPLDTPVIIPPAPFGTKPHVITREWRYYCDICSDSGWDEFWCDGSPAVPGNRARQPWVPIAPCDRTKPHLPHSFVRACHCESTNIAIQARKQTSAKYAAQRSERKSA
jgi:hypothetical protein